MDSTLAATDRPVVLHVNGAQVTLPASPGMTLLQALRNGCGLNGPKYGCGLGECGACTVLIDGVAARACVIPAGAVRNRRITTLEGLLLEGTPGPTQQAFIDCEAAQCGYCLNGMIMTVEALLRRKPDPTEHDIRRELHHNLCRCGTHVEILQAARRAAELRRQGSQVDGRGEPG